MFNGCAVRIKDGAHTMPLKHATLGTQVKQTKFARQIKGHIE
jgi:hypothetical protein